MAGFRVLRDLAKTKRVEGYLESIIRPGKESEFWGKFSSFANFCKHADRDPYAISRSFREKANDHLLFVSATYYQLLRHQETEDMMILVAWHYMLHPDVISDTGNLAPIKPVLSDALKANGNPDRANYLACGLTALRQFTRMRTPGEKWSNSPT